MVNVFAVVAFTVPLLNFEVQGRGQQNQEQDGNRLIGWAIDKLDTGEFVFGCRRVETNHRASSFRRVTIFYRCQLLEVEPIRQYVN